MDTGFRRYDEFIRVSLIMNGGAAVSLLVFLQAIVKTHVELAKVTMIAVRVLYAGVAAPSCFIGPSWPGKRDDLVQRHRAVWFMCWR